MEENDFKDLQKAADSFVITAKVNISQVSCINIMNENPSLLHVKTTFSDIASCITNNILKKGRYATTTAGVKKLPNNWKEKLFYYSIT